MDVYGFESQEQFDRVMKAVRKTEDFLLEQRQGGLPRPPRTVVGFIKVTSVTLVDDTYYPALVQIWTGTEWTDGTDCLAYDLLGATSLTVDQRYYGIVLGHVPSTVDANQRPVFTVLKPGGGSGPFLARITGAPDPADYPPPGDGGGEYSPPRFSYHVYTFTSLDFDHTTGEWAAGTITGVGYRSPSTQYPPPKIIAGESVMAQESVTSPGFYLLTPWGSQRQVTETFTTRVEFVCVDGVAYAVNYQRTRRQAARDLCVSSTTSEGE